MITKCYSVFDSKAEAFMQPFFAAQKGLAIRSFTDLVNDPKTTVNQYPADFTLFELGEFDDLKGVLTPHKTPVSLGIAIEFKREQAA